MVANHTVSVSLAEALGMNLTWNVSQVLSGEEFPPEMSNTADNIRKDCKADDECQKSAYAEEGPSLVFSQSNHRCGRHNPLKS